MEVITVPKATAMGCPMRLHSKKERQALLALTVPNLASGQEREASTDDFDRTALVPGGQRAL